MFTIAVVNHRRILFSGYKQRGKLANHNGNLSLFLTSFLLGKCLVVLNMVIIAANPNRMLYSGKSQFTQIPFYFVWLGYLILYFTKAITEDPKQNVANYNETHVSGVISGLLLGLLLRRKM